jgi:hypothetical protein
MNEPYLVEMLAWQGSWTKGKEALQRELSWSLFGVGKSGLRVEQQKSSYPKAVRYGRVLQFPNAFEMARRLASIRPERSTGNLRESRRSAEP